jgi:hypothetical protein
LFDLKRSFDGQVGGDGCGLEIDHSGYFHRDCVEFMSIDCRTCGAKQSQYRENARGFKELTANIQDLDVAAAGQRYRLTRASKRHGAT